MIHSPPRFHNTQGICPVQVGTVHPMQRRFVGCRAPPSLLAGIDPGTAPDAARSGEAKVCCSDGQGKVAPASLGPRTVRPAAKPKDPGFPTMSADPGRDDHLLVTGQKRGRASRLFPGLLSEYVRR